MLVYLSRGLRGQGAEKRNGGLLELLETDFACDACLPLPDFAGFVMAGRNTFALMPTRGSKSLYYQLPVLALPGLTLVVTRLIALMQDQFDSLEVNGIPAGFFSSTARRPTARRPTPNSSKLSGGLSRRGTEELAQALRQLGFSHVPTPRT